MNKLSFNGALKIIGLAALVVLLITNPAVATVPYSTERVNVGAAGSQMMNGNVQSDPKISRDGRYVAFASSSSEIVPNDTNNSVDVFVRDRQSGTNVRATLSDTDEQLPWSMSEYFAFSANGRFVAFLHSYGGVVEGDTNNKVDVFVRDIKNETTERVSVSSSGAQGNNSVAYQIDISSDGRYVVFSSLSNNLVSGDTNNMYDVFVRDRKLGTTELISKSKDGIIGDHAAVHPSLSCDGSRVVFMSQSTNLTSDQYNGTSNVFLVNRITGHSIENLTVQANNYSTGQAGISCNGEKVIFISYASNLVDNDTNSASDIFIYDVANEAYDRVNLTSNGSETYWPSGVHGSIPTYSINSSSIDFSGRYVAFSAPAPNLVDGDTNNTVDVFLRDVESGTTQLITRRSVNEQTVYSSGPAAISANGREVIYHSRDTGLVDGDTNGLPDVFVSETGI